MVGPLWQRAHAPTWALFVMLKCFTMFHDVSQCFTIRTPVLVDVGDRDIAGPGVVGL